MRKIICICIPVIGGGGIIGLIVVLFGGAMILDDLPTWLAGGESGHRQRVRMFSGHWRVSDPRAILTLPEVFHLEQLLEAGEHQTHAQIVVSVIDSIGSESVESYARRRAANWGPGFTKDWRTIDYRKGPAERIVLVVLTTPPKAHLEVGQSLRPVISGELGRTVVAESMLPGMKSGDYARSIELTARVLFRAIGQKLVLRGREQMVAAAQQERADATSANQPDRGSAGPSGPLAPVTSRSPERAEPSEEASSIPTEMLGFWRGEVSQPGSPTYSVELRIGPEADIKVEYPALTCGGSLKRMKVKNDEMLLRERIEHNQQGRCINDGSVRLVVRSDGQLGYEWYYPMTNPPAGLGASAVLSQASASRD